MNTDNVFEIKGRKRWAKNDPGYWLQSGSALLAYLDYLNEVLIDKNDLFETGLITFITIITDVRVLLCKSNGSIAHQGGSS
jgi:hypothetical protein